jgi:hypothetical protein
VRIPALLFVFLAGCAGRPLIVHPVTVWTTTPTVVATPYVVHHPYFVPVSYVTPTVIVVKCPPRYATKPGKKPPPVYISPRRHPKWR